MEGKNTKQEETLKDYVHSLFTDQKKAFQLYSTLILNEIEAKDFKKIRKQTLIDIGISEQDAEILISGNNFNNDGQPQDNVLQTKIKQQFPQTFQHLFDEIELNQIINYEQLINKIYDLNIYKFQERKILFQEKQIQLQKCMEDILDRNEQEIVDLVNKLLLDGIHSIEDLEELKSDEKRKFFKIFEINQIDKFYNSENYQKLKIKNNQNQINYQKNIEELNSQIINLQNQIQLNNENKNQEILQLKQQNQQLQEENLRMNQIQNDNNYQQISQQKKIDELNSEIQKYKNENQFIIDNKNQEIDQLKQQNQQLQQEIFEMKQLQNQINQQQIQQSIKQQNLNFNESSLIQKENQKIWLLDQIRSIKQYQNIQLIFKGTRDGFEYEQFHKISNNRGPLVFIFQSHHKRIFGAFITTSFSKSQEGYKKHRDDSAFVFQLDQLSRHNTYRNQNVAVQTHPDWLILFGCDIAIADNCNTNNNSCSNFGWNYKPPNGIKWDTPAAESYLAGSHYFKIQEIEIFELKEMSC